MAARLGRGQKTDMCWVCISQCRLPDKDLDSGILNHMHLCFHSPSSRQWEMQASEDPSPCPPPADLLYFPYPDTCSYKDRSPCGRPAMLMGLMTSFHLATSQRTHLKSATF